MRYWKGIFAGSFAAYLLLLVSDFFGQALVQNLHGTKFFPYEYYDLGTDTPMLSIGILLGFYLIIVLIGGCLSYLGSAVFEFFELSHWAVFAFGGGIPAVLIFNFIIEPFTRNVGTLEIVYGFIVAFITGATAGMVYWAIAIRPLHPRSRSDA